MAENKALVDLEEKSNYGSEEKSNNDADDNSAVTSQEGVNTKPEVGAAEKQTMRKKRAKRTSRTSSLSKVEEETEKEAKVGRNPFGCSDFPFGVRSYLHNFYDQRVYKDPELYEDDDYRYLLNGSYPRRKRCTAIWWKVFVWIGANFLVFGILGVLIGYLVPPKSIVIGTLAENRALIDSQAIAFNFHLDVCKLVGLILFCIGGITLTVALLFPSFLYRYFEDDQYYNEGFKVRATHAYYDEPPLSPTEKNIPSQSLVKNVQPDRKEEESIVTKEGMLPYHD